MRAVIGALLVALSTQCLAHDGLIDAIAPGQYILLGKAYESPATYTGQVVIEAAGSTFSVTRSVVANPIPIHVSPRRLIPA